MKLKVFLFLVVVLVAGYTAYNSVQINTKLADLSLMSIESLAGENDGMGNGEANGGLWTGYVNNSQSCNIKETYECKIGFTIPNWVPYVGGMSCQFNYIDEVNIPGTRNDCIYTGNPTQVCDYYRCTRNK